jgi:hypothetical protein
VSQPSQTPVHKPRLSTTPDAETGHRHSPCQLYLVCTGDGMPIMWCLANPKIGEREGVAALLAR